MMRTAVPALNRKAAYRKTSWGSVISAPIIFKKILALTLAT